MSSADRYERLQELFFAVCDLDEPQRAAYLRGVAEDDPGLREEVERLIRRDRSFREAPETGAGRAFTEDMRQCVCEVLGAPEPVELGGAVGRFRILRRLRAGGMATVYEAQQDHPFRTVALKLLNSGTVDPQLLRRFELESHVLGQLQHPALPRFTTRARGRRPLVRGRSL